MIDNYMIERDIYIDARQPIETDEPQEPPANPGTSHLSALV